MESRGFSESDEEPNGSSVADGTPAKSQGPDLQKMIRKIAAFAAQRRLNDAVKAFGEISAKGLEPSVQAYASLINAHVNRHSQTQSFWGEPSSHEQPPAAICQELLMFSRRC